MSHHTRRVGVNVILTDQSGKLLLMRRNNSGWADGMLGLPSGHLEEGETARSAATRELREELDLLIAQDRMTFLAVGYIRTNHENLNVAIHVTLSAGETPTIAEPHKCSELVWSDPNDLPTDTQDVFRTIIIDSYINHAPYLEIGY